MDVVSLERFEVFHFGTKRSQLLTDVVSPSLYEGGTHIIQAGSLSGVFIIFLRLALSKSSSKLDNVSSFMSRFIV